MGERLRGLSLFALDQPARSLLYVAMFCLYILRPCRRIPIPAEQPSLVLTELRRKRTSIPSLKARTDIDQAEMLFLFFFSYFGCFAQRRLVKAIAGG